MSDAVYKSTASSVIDAIETTERNRQEWGEKMRALGRELMPGSEGNFYSSDMAWVSYSLDGEMPTGWKWARPRNNPGIVPDKRTAEGKAWAKRIDAVRSKPFSPAPPGMPQGFVGTKGIDMCWFRPAFAVVDGVAWCRWGSEPTEKVDADIWTKVKLSEFYAMVEANKIEIA